jgi:SHS2 domain-containing protein
VHLLTTTPLPSLPPPPQQQQQGGTTLGEAFEQQAIGMFGYMTDLSTVDITNEELVTVEVEGQSINQSINQSVSQSVINQS